MQRERQLHCTSPVPIPPPFLHLHRRGMPRRRKEDSTRLDSTWQTRIWH